MELDKIAGNYDPTSPARDFDYWLIQHNFETLKSFLVGSKVIELGCSRGTLTEKLARACQEVKVVEGSQRNIGYARENVKNCDNVEFHCSMWQDFEYENSDISDVIFFMGLEHLDREDGLKLLNKIRNWLRPGGKLHVVVPNAYSLHRRVAYYMGIIGDVHEFSERDKLIGHKRVYDREALFQEIRECGYKVVHWEGIFLKPLPNDMMMNLNEEVIRGFYEVGMELPNYCARIFAVCEK